MVFSVISTRLPLHSFFNLFFTVLCAWIYPPPRSSRIPTLLVSVFSVPPLPCLLSLFLSSQSTPALSPLFVPCCVPSLRLPCLFNLFITVFSVYAFPVSSICLSLSSLCLRLPCTVSSICSSLSSLCLCVPCLFYLFFTVFSVYAFPVINLFITVFSLSAPSLSPLFVPHCLLFLPRPQPSLSFVL